MTGSRWDAWEPQEPPADFAARTVAAARVERAERAARGRARRFPGRRAVITGATAAVMFAGVAWGFTAWRTRPVAVQRPGAPPVTATESVHRVARPSALVPREIPSAEVPPTLSPSTAPTVVPPAPVRHRVDVPAASAAPDAGRKVIVPPCECTAREVMCTCF